MNEDIVKEMKDLASDRHWVDSNNRCMSLEKCHYFADKHRIDRLIDLFDYTQMAVLEKIQTIQAHKKRIH
jgi:hypothetical protein